MGAWGKEGFLLEINWYMFGLVWAWVSPMDVVHFLGEVK